jgi:hypothetical protein
LAAVIGSEHQDQLELADKSVDLILRILDSTPYHNITPVNTAVLQARHALLDLLVVALQAVERQISPEEDLQLPDGIQPPQPGDVFQVVLKLLEYTLGLPVMEVTSPAAMPKPDFSRLALSYLRVLMVDHPR